MIEFCKLNCILHIVEWNTFPGGILERWHLNLCLWASSEALKTSASEFLEEGTWGFGRRQLEDLSWSGVFFAHTVLLPGFCVFFGVGVGGSISATTGLGAATSL